MLCLYSDFFRAAFKGSFKEAIERKIELPDVDVDTFEAFQVWLYSQSVRNVEGSQDSIFQSAKLPSFWVLARLWVFGDRHQIPLLQNCAIDALIQKNRDENRFALIVVQTAYENTLHGSPLRRFAIDCCVFRMVHRQDENSILGDSNLCCWSKDALVDFARCMSNAWEHKLPWAEMPSREKCHYHVHANVEHC